MRAEETGRPRPPVEGPHKLQHAEYQKLCKNQRHMGAADIGQHKTTHRSTHQTTTSLLSLVDRKFVTSLTLFLPSCVDKFFTNTRFFVALSVIDEERDAFGDGRSKPFECNEVGAGMEIVFALAQTSVAQVANSQEQIGTSF